MNYRKETLLALTVNEYVFLFKVYKRKALIFTCLVPRSTKINIDKRKNFHL